MRVVRIVVNLLHARRTELIIFAAIAVCVFYGRSNPQSVQMSTLRLGDNRIQESRQAYSTRSQKKSMVLQVPQKANVHTNIQVGEIHGQKDTDD